MNRGTVVAIDGPAGSGKSTVAKLLAKKLNLLYIDTGAMYRALTLAVLGRGIEVADPRSIIVLAKKCRIGLENTSDGNIKVTLDNVDVTKSIRIKAVDSLVSDIARIGGVREIMVHLQRRLARCGRAVLEGRDIGTVVFPDADFKFFLDADVDERTKRRYKQIKTKFKTTFSEIKENVRKRDKIDSARCIGPLKKADDAIYIDTTSLTIKEVVDVILKHIRRS